MATAATDLANVPAGGVVYKDAVSTLESYDVNTDLPDIDLSDFNGGAAGAPFAYLMY